MRGFLRRHARGPRLVVDPEPECPPLYENGQPVYAILIYAGRRRLRTAGLHDWYCTVRAAEDTYIDGPYLTERRAEQAAAAWIEGRKA